VKAPPLSSKSASKLLLATLFVGLGQAPRASAQTTAPTPPAPPTTSPAAPTTAPARNFALAPELAGRRVEGIRIVGNHEVSSNVIMNVVRTREGEPFDPATVEEDYQRIFDLKRFANVEAKVEPTRTGVIVVFIVNEQKQVASIAFRGNNNVSTRDLQESAGISTGQSLDRFRLALARQSIQNLYRDKGYPYAHVEIPEEPLNTRGELIFNITEGPHVRVRKLDFIGRNSFTEDRLRDVVKTRYWIWIFRPGTFDPEMIEDDVAALRRFYTDHGFFDVKVGRKIIVSPDQTEVQVNFLIDEGPRYTVRNVLFQGNTTVGEAQLRKDLRMTTGQPWSEEFRDRDVREIVRAYSPYGFVYQEGTDSPDPDYLRITPRRVFTSEPTKFDLVYDIHEGKPFRLGRVIVKGNDKTQDKVVLREMRVSSGQLYNSAALTEAQDRIKSIPAFSSVKMTPIGDDPQSRDVLVEVTEARTAQFLIGAGVSSNGGIAGNLTYEQRNFDIGNWPDSWRDVFNERSFTGAGQNFRATFEPGTEFTNASVRFSDPYLFDQPYSFFNELYIRDRIREDYHEVRIGDRLGFGKRFDYVNSVLLTLRGEDVNVREIENPRDRAPQILQYAGHTTITSASIQYRRNTTKGGYLPYEGTDFQVGLEQYGALGGEAYFQKYTSSFNLYQNLYTDLLDRRTILNYHVETGFIPTNDAPFFEKFYGGGIGSIRGFEYRGISPRAGRFDDRIGGNFELAGGLELSFPIAGDIFRGVVFTDVGTVEPTVEIRNVRSSVGAGIRLILPFFGQAPLALDFAVPITQSKRDDTQIISFSFGVVP
jgi:outer membrane protein insertion porin family